MKNTLTAERTNAKTKTNSRVGKVKEVYKDLDMLHKAHELVLMVYQASKSFPEDEKLGLTAHFRREALLVTGNISEGYKKQNIKEKLSHMHKAWDSLEKCRYLFILTADLEYQNNQKMYTKIERLSDMLNAYCKSVLKSTLMAKA